MKAIKIKKEKFLLRCYLVLISADIGNAKQYILSTKKSEIEIPHVNLAKDNINNIENFLISYMKDLIFVNDLELIPQIINLNNTSIKTEEGTVNIVYGFVTSYTKNINESKVYWCEFNYKDHTKYSDMIAEVVRKLK
jgi:pyruvate formate-lyase activating enzyme-like uncharacterized protein